MEITKQLKTTVTASGIIGALIGGSVVLQGYHMAAFGAAVLVLAVMQLDQFRTLDDLDGPVHQVFFAQVLQPFLISALAILGAMKIYAIDDQKEAVMKLIVSLGISFQLVMMLVLGFRVCQHAWSHPSVVTARQQRKSVFWMFMITCALFIIQLASILTVM